MRGQAVIILLLIMFVALAIGLAITQRSLNDLSTSTKGEQSTRAFSAAEAGLEKALQSQSSIPSISLGNQSSATVNVTPTLPLANQALEYPPIGKDTVAQFWLANPQNLTEYYPRNTDLNIYFGNANSDLNSADTPALEVNLITLDSSNNYNVTKYFFDPNSTRRNTNGFRDIPNCSGTFTINTSNSPDTATLDRNFLCRVLIGNVPNQEPVMIRARILYTNTKQPISTSPLGNNSLPPQATIYTSVGSSGQTQQTVQVFQLPFVVPHYFDFAIFSAGDISK